MKSSRTASVSNKPAPRRHTSVRKRRAKKKASRTMPIWLHNTLTFVVVGLFSVAFYYFVIRPYSYHWKEYYEQKEYGVCIPCDYEVHGIGISHYQGNIDWEELKQNKGADFPLRFIFMKATEGGGHGNDTFKQNLKQTRQHGFIRGAYHFFTPRTDALKRADLFTRTVKLDNGDLLPVFDVELSGKRSKRELQQSIKKWLGRAEAHYGVKPIFYTSYKFKTHYLDDSPFNAYPYWITHYYVDSVKYQGKWHFWQHTDAGSVPNIHHDVGLNTSNGSLEELRKMTMR